MIWSIIEPNVYLISACLLAMRPLLSLVFGDESSRYGSRKKYDSSRYSSNLKPSISSLGGFSGGPKAARSGPSSSFKTPFDSALYGDEIQLVSVAEKDVETDREACMQDQIHVHKDMNIVVDNAGSIDRERPGP